MLFYAITDRRLADPLAGLDRLREIHGDNLLVQLREKDLPARALFKLGAKLLERINRSQLLINDRVDVAKALGVGVQLPHGAIDVAAARQILGAVRIGVSCHSPEACAKADREGADLVTLSPIWPSPGKGGPLGLQALREAKSQMQRAKLIALGGVDESNANDAIKAGADGVAAIRWAWDRA